MMAQKNATRSFSDQIDKNSESNLTTITYLVGRITKSVSHSPNCRRLKTVEDFIIIWLDSNIDESHEDSQTVINQLRQLINAVQTFNEIEQCITYFDEIKDERIFVIVSDTLGPRFVPRIYKKKQLASIYVLCDNKEEQKQWVLKFPMIKGIFTEIEDLCIYLKLDLRQNENNFTSFSIISSFSTTDLNELDPSFMYSQILKEILLEEKTTLQEKKKFIEFCRGYYSDNNKELPVIDEFENRYPDPSLIWWYTRDCFLYLMLNKALRTHDVEIIIKMGFIIRDLHRNIEQFYVEQHFQDPLTVYRGQGMVRVEFEKIKKSSGGLLAFNSFLSTTTNMNVSLTFIPSSYTSPELVAVVFRIQIDPTISTTPFADVKNVSCAGSGEQEILFSMHTIFRIGETTQLANGLYQVDLALTKDNDKQLVQLTEYMRKVTQGPTGLHRLGQLMCHMGEFDKAKEIYTTLVDTTSSDDRQQLALFHHQLGYISKKKNNLSSALSHYQESLDIKLTYLPSDDPQLSSTYCNIGSVLQDQGDLDGALEHLKFALKSDLRASKPDRLSIAIRHNNIGSVLEDLGNYHEALMSYRKALELQLSQVSKRHPSIATSYNNIGLVHRKMGDNLNALTYYRDALDIFERSLPSLHSSLATSHHNIAMVFDDLRRTKEAIKHAERALEITLHSNDIEHPDVLRRQAYLDDIRRKL